MQTLMINWWSICCVIILYYNPKTNTYPSLELSHLSMHLLASSKLPENLLGFQENNVSASSHFVIIPAASHDCWAILNLQNIRQYFKSPINANLQAAFKDTFLFNCFKLLSLPSPCIFIYLHIIQQHIGNLGKGSRP